MYTIYVDKSRETGVLNAIRTLPCVNDKAGTYNVREERLKDGDIQVFLWNKLILIIERKRVIDLSASWCDGRLLNCFNLSLLAKETTIRNEDDKFEFSPMIVLLIEGRFRRGSKRCLSKKDLENVLDEFRYRIPNLQVIYTADTSASGERVLSLVQNMPSSQKEGIRTFVAKQVGFPEEKLEFKTKILPPISTALPAPNATPTPNEKKKRYLLYGNQMKLHQKLLRSLDGISIRMSHLILDSKWTAFDIVLNRIHANDLSTLRYPTGRTLPPQKAEAICSYNTEEKQRQTLQSLFQKIPYIKNKHALSVMASLLFRLQKEGKKLKIKDIIKDPNCVKYAVSSVAIERIVSVFAFHPQ